MQRGHQHIQKINSIVHHFGNNRELLNENTSFRSLALRFQMKILKTRQVPASECVFLLQSHQNYHSTTSFKRIGLNLNKKDRLIYLDDNDTPVLGKSQFEKYVEATNKPNNPFIGCYDDFNRLNGTPVYIGMQIFSFLRKT